MWGGGGGGQRPFASYRATPTIAIIIAETADDTRPLVGKIYLHHVGHILDPHACPEPVLAIPMFCPEPVLAKSTQLALSLI
eukprot:COSAG06_NODE_5296_length_3579_cov_5.150862_5_plen_81_part_00